MRPVLALAVIVKNEGHTVLRTLDSCADSVDYFAVYDTGSTDGTQEVVRGWRQMGRQMADVTNGSLLQAGPFVNYAQARNAALRLAAARPEPPRFVLSLSADETLVNGDALVRFLSTYDGDEDAFLIEVRATGGLFDYPRVLRTNGGLWRYEGEIHEVPKHREDPNRQPVVKIPDCRIEYAPTDPERHAARLRNQDLPILTRMIATAKSDSDRVRTCLLLAQTHEALATITVTTSFENKLSATQHQVAAFGYYLLLAQDSDDPNLRFKLLNAADVLGIYSSPEMLARLRPVILKHPNDPAVAYMVAVHTANVDARAGLAAANRAAEVAEAAVVDKANPYDPHGLLWRPHWIAAMCAKAIGDKNAARDHASQGMKWKGPPETFKEFVG